jgi:hypothetical protein
MVPVFDENKKPLMPCSEKRARKLCDRGDARPYWHKGIFCIILQRKPKSRYMQDIVLAIDPGSKFNGYTVKSEAHTLLNLQVEAITDVKSRVEERTQNRGSRRQRKTPYRKCRFNRSVKERLAPSTKARWQQHINILKYLSKMYKITCVAVEDICAKTIKNARKWNSNFSPIEVGKNWFYKCIEVLGLKLYKYSGFETYQIRNEFGLKKNSKKDKKCFFTHCVDTFCLATQVIGGNGKPDNIFVKFLKPLRYHKRKLHEVLPKKNGFRRTYGGTLSLGLKRGTLVEHIKHGICLIGGTSKGFLSLHDVSTNKRLCQNAKIGDFKILTNLKWNIA